MRAVSQRYRVTIKEGDARRPFVKSDLRKQDLPKWIQSWLRNEKATAIHIELVNQENQ